MNQCCHCGRQMRKKKGYTWNSEFYGRIILPDAEYWHCSCGADEISHETHQTLEEITRQRCSELLLQRLHSLDEINHLYLQNKELVKKLGVTRQAIAKNVLLPQKIYNIILFGQRYYLRESVDLFLQTGDGRFPLHKKTGKKAENISLPPTQDHNVIRSDYPSQKHAECLVLAGRNI